MDEICVTKFDVYECRKSDRASALSGAQRAEIIRRNADAAGRRRIKRPESENPAIFVGFLHLV